MLSKETAEIFRRSKALEGYDVLQDYLADRELLEIA